MRETLQTRAQEGNRFGIFRCLFIKFGTRFSEQTNREEKTALLKYIKDERGVQIADHVWVWVHDSTWARLPVEYGDWLTVDAYIRPYRRADNTEEYTLSVNTVRVQYKRGQKEAEEKAELLKKLQAGFWNNR